MSTPHTVLRPGTKEKFLKVNDILNIFDKPGLNAFYANEAGKAVGRVVADRTNPDFLWENRSSADRAQAFAAAVASGPRSVFLAAGQRGIAIHAALDAHILGNENFTADPSVADDVAAGIAVLDANGFSFNPQAAALMVAKRTDALGDDVAGFCVQLDYTAIDQDGHTWILDFRSSAGIYHTDAMRLAVAYDCLHNGSAWIPHQTGEYTSADPNMPKPDRAGVLHIPAAGEARLIDLTDAATNTETLLGFKGLALAARYARTMQPTIEDAIEASTTDMTNNSNPITEGRAA
ncbi:MAG: hypothetical protein GY871_04880 [Actinomycetales bacterium]|nr:hypothetical protein [Actinomycetales bacterium]